MDDLEVVGIYLEMIGSLVHGECIEGVGVGVVDQGMIGLYQHVIHYDTGWTMSADLALP